MQPKSNLQFVETLLKKLRSFDKYKKCIYPKCEMKSIDSHVIAESVLEQIADKEGKVLTWNPSDHDIVTNAIHGKEWDHVYKKPRRVGIRQEVTYPIFCEEHDNKIFAALEDNGFTFQPHQVALLAYRALCQRTWNPHLKKKLEFLLSNENAEIVQQYQRIFSFEKMLEAREKFEDMIKAQDYRQMQWVPRVFYIEPFMACTNAIIPYRGDEDVRNVINGSSSLTPEDVTTFSFFPEKHLNASVCIITWFRGNKRGESFRESPELGSPSESIIRDNVIETALRMTLPYISQEWWDSLNSELQNHISELQLSNILTP